MICLPEVPFNNESILLIRLRGCRRESASVVIAVSEGVKLEDGRYVCELSNDAHFVDALVIRARPGTARYLSNCVAGALKTKTRSIRLSTLQLRGAYVKPHGYHRGLSGRRRGGKSGV